MRCRPAQASATSVGHSALRHARRSRPGSCGRRSTGTAQIAPVLVAPEDVLALPGLEAQDALAGNVQAVYGARLPRPVAAAMPTAEALLRLAPALWRQGKAVDAALLLPQYVRDKVAQTTAERAAAQEARQAQA